MLLVLAAGHVIAIEASSMALVCRQMVASLGLSDRVTVVNARIEDLTSTALPGLPDGQDSADVIVSEWMGTGLVGEGMLDSVLLARDRWLVPGGRLLPSTARMFVCGWQHAATAELLRLGLGPAAGMLSEKLLEEWRGRPMLTSLPANSVCSGSVCVADLDLTTVPLDGGLDEIISQRSLELTVDGESEEVRISFPSSMCIDCLC
jgi:hypothetical protein